MVNNTRNKILYAGQIINNWTILSKAKCRSIPSGQLKHYWLCKCKCGKEKEVYAGSLRSNKSKSCGCNSPNKKEKGEASRHSVYLCYRGRAKRKELEFTISEDEFIKIIKQPCFYCNRESSNYISAGRRNGGFSYNGIDRFNNDKGYIKNNCVPCCNNCNKAKLDQTHEEFLNMVKLIYERHIK